MRGELGPGKARNREQAGNNTKRPSNKGREWDAFFFFHSTRIDSKCNQGDTYCTALKCKAWGSGRKALSNKDLEDHLG